MEEFAHKLIELSKSVKPTIPLYISHTSKKGEVFSHMVAHGEEHVCTIMSCMQGSFSAQDGVYIAQEEHQRVLQDIHELLETFKVQTGNFFIAVQRPERLGFFTAQKLYVTLPGYYLYNVFNLLCQNGLAHLDEYVFTHLRDACVSKHLPCFYVDRLARSFYSPPSSEQNTLRWNLIGANAEGIVKGPLDRKIKTFKSLQVNLYNNEVMPLCKLARDCVIILQNVHDATNIVIIEHGDCEKLATHALRFARMKESTKKTDKVTKKMSVKAKDGGLVQIKYASRKILSYIKAQWDVIEASDDDLMVVVSGTTKKEVLERVAKWTSSLALGQRPVVVRFIEEK